MYGTGSYLSIIDDNYLLNKEEELNEENLNRVFDLAKKYCTDKDIIETAVPLEKLPRNLEELMWEELTEYFNGNITREQVIDHLKKRIRLYFEEHQNEPKTFRTQ